MPSTTLRDLGKLAFWIVVGVAVLAISWIAVGSILPWVASQVAFGYVVRQVVGVSGWNPNLVKGAVTLALIPFGFAVWEVVRFWNRRWRRTAGQLVICVYVAAYYFLLAAAAKGSYIGKCYVFGDQGIRISDGPCDSPDPVTLRERHPITPDIAASVERARLGIRPERLSPDQVAAAAFFNGGTGEPLVWYFQRSDGEFDLFTSAGFDPDNGEPLRPVTPAIADAARARAGSAVAAEAARKANEAADRRTALAAEGRARYLGSSAPTGTWIIALHDGKTDLALATRVAATFGASSFFTPVFASDGLAVRLLNGDDTPIVDLGLAGATVVVVTLESTQQATEVVGQGLRKCEARLKAVVVRGGSPASFEVSSDGAGFNDQAARDQAIDRAIAALEAKVKGRN